MAVKVTNLSGTRKDPRRKRRGKLTMSPVRLGKRLLAPGTSVVVSADILATYGKVIKEYMDQEVLTVTGTDTEVAHFLAALETELAKKPPTPEPTPEPVVAAPAPKPTPKPAPEPKDEPKRARTTSGTYQPDDPATPDVNEAWVSGKAPKEKAPAEKPAPKKASKRRSSRKKKAE